jgi:hypothetical protein
MINRKYIGTPLPKATLDVEKGRPRFFAKAIGARRTAAVAVIALP